MPLQVVNVFNLFVTYGDTFLPNPTSYDELYYEIIRMHQIFDNIYSMGELHRVWHRENGVELTMWYKETKRVEVYVQGLQYIVAQSVSSAVRTCGLCA